MKQVVYTASPESRQIHVWQLNQQGELTLIQEVKTEGQVQPMTIHPARPLLYAGIRPDFRVITFHIAADGSLSQAGEAPLSGSPNYVATDRKGRFLFNASYSDALFSISPINDEGLPGAPLQTIEGLAGCHSVNIDISNQRLYVPALLQDRICLYQLGEQGELTPCKQPQLTSAAGAGPRHMAFHPNQRYLYSVNELNSSVDVWQADNGSDGVKCIQTLDMMPPDFAGTRWAADIHLTADSRYLYACDRTASIMTLFRVKNDGAQLEVVGWQPTEQQPRGFNIDHSGTYLIAAGQKSHHIAVSRIEQNSGKLVPLARYSAGQGPMWVVIHPL